MDRRLKTALVSTGVALITGAWLPPVAAQPSYNSSYNSGYSSQAQNPDQYETPAQRNPELPTGLTIVPWKLERRADREALLNGGAGSSRGATTQGRQDRN